MSSQRFFARDRGYEGAGANNGKDLGKDDRVPRPQGSNATVLSHPTVEIFPPDVIRRRAITSRGMTAETVQTVDCVKVEYRFCGPMHLLVMYEDGVRRDGETFVEGLPRKILRRFAGKLTFIPAGHQYHEWHELRALSRLTFLYFDLGKLKLQFDTDIADVPFTPRLFFEDEDLWHTALKLAELVESPALRDPLYFEALGVVVVYQLLRLHWNLPSSQPQAKGGLAVWQQRLATAYIEEHLADRIKLAALAQLARQSPFHFCRAFKQSLGMPPLRYQTKRRIERAKLLLAQPAMSVTDVGFTVGFGCSTSFATAFRKATGFTPSAYQRSLRG
jgi:AraC family transcriptional regulator